MAESEEPESRIPDRPTTRAYVERRSKLLQAAAQRGENVHQLALDLEDDFDRRIAAYSQDEQRALIEVYIQEIKARSAFLQDQADRMNAEAEAIVAQRTAHERATEDIGKVIGSILGFITLVGLFILLAVAARH